LCRKNEATQQCAGGGDCRFRVCGVLQSNAPAGSEFQFATDAAAIKATLDTTTAGWNRGELPVYLSAYADSAEVGDPIELVGSQQFGFASRLRAGIRPVGE